MSDELPAQESVEPSPEYHVPQAPPEVIGERVEPPTSEASPFQAFTPPPESPSASPMQGQEYGGIPQMSPPPEFASNYPRVGQTVLGYIRPPGVYWDTLGIAWSMITSNLGVYVASALLMLVMLGGLYIVFFTIFFGTMMAGGGLGSPTTGFTVGMIIPQAILQIGVVFLQFCMIAVGVRHAQGYMPQVSDFFIPFKRIKWAGPAALLVSGPMIVVNLLFSVAQLLAVHSPGLFLMMSLIGLVIGLLVYLGSYPQTVLSGTAAIFGQRSPIETAGELYRRLGWQSLMFGLFVIVGGFASGLGFLLCIVGALFTYPILTNGIALHYIYNYPEDQTPAPSLS